MNGGGQNKWLKQGDSKSEVRYPVNHRQAPNGKAFGISPTVQHSPWRGAIITTTLKCKDDNCEAWRTPVWMDGTLVQ